MDCVVYVYFTVKYTLCIYTHFLLINFKHLIRNEYSFVIVLALIKFQVLRIVMSFKYFKLMITIIFDILNIIFKYISQT